MIRIDLGKDEAERGKKLQSAKPKSKSPFGTGDQKVDLGGFLLLGVACAFACLPYLFVDQYRTFYISQHEAALKALTEVEDGYKQEIAKYTSFQKELESYEQQKKMINDRLSIVRKLLSGRSTPVSVLDAIGQSLPSRGWLSRLELTSEPKPNVALAGNVYSNDEVSDFVEKLTESIYLTDVTLEEVSSTRGMGSETDTRGFSIHATPKGLQPAGVETRDTAGLSAPITQGAAQPPTPAAAGPVQAAPPVSVTGGPKQ